MALWCYFGRTSLSGRTTAAHGHLLLPWHLPKNKDKKAGKCYEVSARTTGTWLVTSRFRLCPQATLVRQASVCTSTSQVTETQGSTLQPALCRNLRLVLWCNREKWNLHNPVDVQATNAPICTSRTSKTLALEHLQFPGSLRGQKTSKYSTKSHRHRRTSVNMQICKYDTLCLLTWGRPTLSLVVRFSTARRWRSRLQ